ncbi:DUF4907 domain-containing protein [Chitinophaga sp. sic0106]|uniref:DUF4907 domain-containing protein n=1 Tax=Chitinophaga sp. sic0106 TaxID=2854785 RepID=UPI001C48B92B|nr:DUF4907 domain-containing protein [Chitinophaga sp. sic0106]MBV7531856.1 DUF4907 domain-containing protein [Chitinophaga sp. sic0106]
MTKRKYLFITSILVLLAAVAWHFAGHKQERSADMLAVVVEPFQIRQGWGYKVNVAGKTFIYQDVIPGVAGNHVFKSRADALRVGQLMVEKLTSHQIPAVSAAEIQQMRISY